LSQNGILSVTPASRKHSLYMSVSRWRRRRRPEKTIDESSLSFNEPNMHHISCHGIDVCFTPELDGGGSLYGPDYVPFLRSKRFRKLDRVFEWCAGPGFIGFHLLGGGACESLCLADVNPETLRFLRETVRSNGLSDRVTIYEADCLESIPASERWDLVVGNPPHYAGDRPLQIGLGELLYRDRDWALHRRFFAEVRSHLKSDGVILLQENYCFARQTTFAPLLAGSGLRLRSASPLPAHPNIFYLWVETDRSACPPNDNASIGRWEFPYSADGCVEESHFLQEHGFLVDGLEPKPRARVLSEMIAYRTPLLEAVHRHRPQWLAIPKGVTLRLTAEDTGENWSFEFGGAGEMRAVNSGRTAQATVRASEAAFLDLFDRRAMPLVAYANAQLKIDGAEWLGLQLIFLLCDPFFAISAQDWGRY
jgi:16S rRNA G966 N2-methylase RsmD